MSPRAWLLNGIFVLAFWVWLLATAHFLAQFIPVHLFG